MKDFKIYACAYGTYWSYDEEYECVQEAVFNVAAENLENALRLVDKQFEKSQGCDWDYDVQAVYYNPKATEIREDDGDDYEEVFYWDYKKPVDGSDVPDEYSNEICEFEFAWMKFLEKEPKAPTDPKSKALAERFFNIGRYGKKR